MATECDVNKSRRFDRGMSRRTRRPTSLVACYEDRYVPPLARQLLQEAKLKRLLQCEDTELQAPQQCEGAEQQMEIPQAPQVCEGAEVNVPEQHQDEEETGQQQQVGDAPPEQCLDEDQKTAERYQDKLEEEEEEQNIPERYQDEEEGEEEQNIPEQYQDEEEEDELNIPEQCLGQEQKIAQQYQDKASEECHDEEQTAPEKCQDEEEKTGKQCQDEDEKASEQHQDEDEKTSEQHQDEEQKAQQGCQDTKQKTLAQRLSVKKPITPPPVGDVPRLSLLELIREKQLGTGEAKAGRNLGYGENAIADHRAPGAAATAGGTTLAMVIRRPDGGKKKSPGIVRRCVKALNHMIKAKHGTKKSLPFKEV